MKRLIITTIITVLMFGCAHFTVKPETTQTVVEIAAFTLGYEGVDRYPRAFNGAAEFIEKMLPFVDVAPTEEDWQITISNIGDGVINLIADHVRGDPLLEHHARKLLDLIYIEIDIGSGKPIPVEQAKLLLAALPEFVAGVRAAQGGK